MEVLKVFADSWPLTVMFIAGCLFIIAMTVIRWWRKSDQEDKAYRASQALTVTPRRPYSDD